MTDERALTDNEQALAYPLFGVSVTYSNVKIYKKKYWPLHPEDPEDEERTAIMTPNGNLYAPGNAYRADYSADSLATKAWFIHEMTHVWQYENKMNLVWNGIVETIRSYGIYDNTYPYTLYNPSRDLAIYRFEQQAAIVADYFLIQNNATPTRLRPNSVTPWGTSNNMLASIYAQGVLKNFLHNPSYLRAGSGVALNTPGVVNSTALLSSNPSIYRSKNTQLGHLQANDRLVVVDLGVNKPFNKTHKRWQWCEVEVKSGNLNGQKGWVMRALITGNDI